VVFCGCSRSDAADFEKLRDSIPEARLNDAASVLRWRTFAASLRLPLRPGLLHLEIIKERLTREYDLY